MSCPAPVRLGLCLVLLLTLSGCHPTQPLYLRDTGDLSYYLDRATAIEYPDVDTAILADVTHARPPITTTQASFDSLWDLTLEDVVSIAMQNSKVIRGFGTPSVQGGRVAPGVDNLLLNPLGAGTFYNVAIRESAPGSIGLPGQIGSPSFIVPAGALEANQGVEAALADFDAQLTSALFWNRTDQPQNVVIGTRRVFVQDQATWQTELSKRTATGTQIFFRNVSTYTRNNNPLADAPGGFQFLSSVYTTAMEVELRQPLMRGRGTFINRMPVVIARIQTDQEIANLEAQVQNMVTNVEIRYWDLYLAYRNLETAKAGRDAALDTWRMVYESYRVGRVPIQDESEAREQYYFFRAEVERAWAALLDAESSVRWLMGIATTDGRLIRPIDEPSRALVQMEWHDLLEEALVLRPELRQQRWEIKKRNLQLQYAKNGLLPSLNATALYRWLGHGDRYIDYGDTPEFPNPGSGAWNELMQGDFQEFRAGLDFGMPIGYRRELANVRHSQLMLARDLARLEDMELELSRDMAEALRAMDLNYGLAQTNFNRWAAAMAELQARMDRYEAGTDPISFMLDAQRRRAQGEQAYYQALVEYNKVLALIHRWKGTVLQYNGVSFGEGPWPDKAYWDASERARKRSASRPMNYGFTRPGVISRGPLSDGFHCADGSCGGFGEAGFVGEMPISVDSYPAEFYPSFHDGSINGQPRQPTPADQPTRPTPLPMPQPQQHETQQPGERPMTSRMPPRAETPRPNADPLAAGAQPTQGQTPKAIALADLTNQGGRLNQASPSGTAPIASAPSAPSSAQSAGHLAQSGQPVAKSSNLDWDRVGLGRPNSGMATGEQTRAVIRPVNFEQHD